MSFPLQKASLSTTGTLFMPSKGKESGAIISKDEKEALVSLVGFRAIDPTRIDAMPGIHLPKGLHKSLSFSGSPSGHSSSPVPSPRFLAILKDANPRSCDGLFLTPKTGSPAASSYSSSPLTVPTSK